MEKFEKGTSSEETDEDRLQSHLLQNFQEYTQSSSSPFKSDEASEFNCSQSQSSPFKIEASEVNSEECPQSPSSPFKSEDNEVNREEYYENCINRARLRRMDMEDVKGLVCIIATQEPLEKRREVFHKYVIEELMPILPLKANDESDWIPLFEKINEICLNIDGFSLFDVEATFLKCTEKIGESFTKASRFWYQFRKLYVTMKDNGVLSEMEFRNKIVNMFKNQFMCAYVGVGNDFELAMEYLKNKNWLDQDTKILFQSIFYKYASSEELVIERTYPEFDQTNENNHHTEFEKFMRNVETSKVTWLQRPPHERIAVHCEEAICAEPSSPCWYWIYITLLGNKSLLGTMPDREKVLHNIIQRASLHIEKEQSSCSILHDRFWETALSVAAEDLIHEMEGIIDCVLENLPWEAGSEKRCFHARRAILISTKHLIEEGHWSNDMLDKVFNLCIHPATENIYREGYYESQFDPIDQEEICGYLMELLSLKVSLYAKVFGQCQDEMTATYISYFNHNYLHNNTMLKHCINFIRQHGTEVQIRNMFDQLLDGSNPNHMTCSRERERYMLVLKNQMEFLAENGPLSDFISVETKYISLSSTFQQARTENYNGDHVMQEKERTSLEEDGIVDEEEPNCIGPCNYQGDQQEETNHLPVAVDLASHSRKQNNSQSRLRRQDLDVPNGERKTTGKGFPLFLINLNYRTTKDDLKQAFTALKYNVVSVQLKSTRRGPNPGYGKIFLDSEESVNDAIERYNKVLAVGGRLLTLEAYKNKKTTGAQSANRPENRAPPNQEWSLEAIPANEFDETRTRMGETHSEKWANLAVPSVTQTLERGKEPRAGSKRPYPSIAKETTPTNAFGRSRLSFVPTQVRRTQARRLELPSISQLELVSGSRSTPMDMEPLSSPPREMDDRYSELSFSSTPQKSDTDQTLKETRYLNNDSVLQKSTKPAPLIALSSDSSFSQDESPQKWSQDTSCESLNTSIESVITVKDNRTSTSDDSIISIPSSPPPKWFRGKKK